MAQTAGIIQIEQKTGFTVYHQLVVTRYVAGNDRQAAADHAAADFPTADSAAADRAAANIAACHLGG